MGIVGSPNRHTLRSQQCFFLKKNSLANLCSQVESTSYLSLGSFKHVSNGYFMAQMPVDYPISLGVEPLPTLPNTLMPMFSVRIYQGMTHYEIWLL